MTQLLLVGATGLVGGCVLQRALADARVSRVCAPTRRALPSHPKLDNPLVDFEKLPTDATWWQADAVICTLGTTIHQAGSQAAFRRVDVDYVQIVAEHARRHGTQCFALNSSLGADSTSSNFYLRCKGEIEQAVQAMGYLSLTIVRPSIIGGEREKRRPLEHLGMRAFQVLKPMVPKRYRVVSADTIAAYMLAAVIAAEPGCRIIESDALQSVS